MSEELSAEQMLASVAADKPAATSEGSPESAPQIAPGPDLKAEFEYAIQGGKQVKEPLEMILKRAGMGYHYAQQMHQINQQTDKFKEIEARNKALARWEEYDTYAKSNPDWSKHVEQSWQNRTNLQQSENTAPNPEIVSLREELQELKKFRDEMSQRELKSQRSTEDKQFADEITQTEKQFGVDLSQADEKGRSLQWRILEHMEQMGLDGSKAGHFKMAFKDFYFDQLQSRQKEQTQEQQVKAQAELKKAGIKNIATKPASTSNSAYRPGLNWNELGDMALAELRASQKRTAQQ